nr:(R)-mandelonitrile lyase 1-like [Ziziphus jujuba var. spinosa]
MSKQKTIPLIWNSIHTMVALILLLLFHLFLPQQQILALPTGSNKNDFSYMKSVYNASDLPIEEEYDYIIVGGGTAGCPLAATLSEKYSVLVLERGSVPAAYPQVLSADGLLRFLIQVDDGNTPAQRFKSEDGVANARGRILGGSSMINIGFYSRAEDEFYKESGIQWDMDMVEKAYQWVEETVVFRSDHLSVWQSIAKQALLEAGVGPENGFSLDHIVGTKVGASIFDEDGRRHGAVELLNRGQLANLQIAVHATVERIIFSSDPSGLSARGVLYSDSKGKSHRAHIRDKGEVILSAGSIGSPQLLLLSGVGPDSELSSQQIPIVHPNPYVGKFMADNPRNTINIISPFPLDPSYVQVVGITNDYYIESLSSKVPSSLLPPSTLFPNATFPVDVSVATVGEKIVGPLSTGSLRLASPADVRDNPVVRFNYFEDPVDLARCVSGMRKIGEVLKTESMDRFKLRGLLGGEGFVYFGAPFPVNPSDDLSMEVFCKTTVETFWHYHGGCLVGKVVDGDLRVMGINALRVVDGSTFNRSPGTNPQATVMMMARYMGLKMLQQRSPSK